jgi:hypothetical protein
MQSLCLAPGDTKQCPHSPCTWRAADGAVWCAQPNKAAVYSISGTIGLVPGTVLNQTRSTGGTTDHPSHQHSCTSDDSPHNQHCTGYLMGRPPMTFKNPPPPHLLSSSVPTAPSTGQGGAASGGSGGALSTPLDRSRAVDCIRHCTEIPTATGPAGSHRTQHTAHTTAPG